jgi:hypothetical protein
LSMMLVHGPSSDVATDTGNCEPALGWDGRAGRMRASRANREAAAEGAACLLAPTLSASLVFRTQVFHCALGRKPLVPDLNSLAV